MESFRDLPFDDRAEEVGEHQEPGHGPNGEDSGNDEEGLATA